ncbi:class I SAM-dependent methyltransferase [Shimia sp. R9_2]|uniref:class I SAM-dependent methyltransferase n=1 Tax=Shimia sp. R9_2 TaxID=2821112 RepID=UPI001AD9C8D3|nr:class I SAM-dependent methyltransferase [Shimia sp. R9_2]MBO9398264.1 class I SAM-dependent methyltransferase [Shimia sp. R9_2]
MPSPQDLSTVKANMHAVYDRNAAHWDAQRDLSLREADWLAKVMAGLPQPADVLDLGCGAGRPLAAHLVALGHRVTGIDASPAMITLAQSNVPAATFHVMDMRALTLEEGFDVLLSWDAFFHLSPEEQRVALPKMLSLLRPGGNLLLTVGHGEGEVAGRVAGEPVYHGSLDPSEYLEILEGAGFAHARYTPNDPTVLGRYVLLACGKGMK